jgi:hypothetical protein
MFDIAKLQKVFHIWKYLLKYIKNLWTEQQNRSNTWQPHQIDIRALPSSDECGCIKMDKFPRQGDNL